MAAGAKNVSPYRATTYDYFGKLSGITNGWGCALPIRVYNGRHTRRNTRGQENETTRTEPRRDYRRNQQQGAMPVPTEVRLPLDNRDANTQPARHELSPLDWWGVGNQGTVERKLRRQVGLTTSRVSGKIHAQYNAAPYR